MDGDSNAENAPVDGAANTTDTTVTVKVQVTEKDYMNAIWAASYLSKWIVYLIFGCCYGLVLHDTIENLIISYDGPTVDGLLGTWIILLILTSVIALNLRKARKEFRSNRLLHSPHTVTATQNEIALQNEFTMSRVAWHILYRWRETSAFFFIHQSRMFAYILPKRSFASQEDIDRFRQHLTDGIGPRGKVCKG